MNVGDRVMHHSRERGGRATEEAKKASELALCATGPGDKDVIKLLSLCQKIKNNLDS